MSVSLLGQCPDNGEYGNYFVNIVYLVSIDIKKIVRVLKACLFFFLLSY